MSIALILRRGIVRFFAASLIVVSLITPALVTASTSQPRDNDTNAIMYGGAYSKSEWASNVSKGDSKNSASNLQQIYYNEGRGITNANFMASYTVDGTVFKDGHVEVDGKTVATGAKSVGRTNMTGSTKSGSVWERPTSVSFVADSIPAYVDMQNGEFHYAIIKSCGNPVKATPVKRPTPTPTATPKPTPKPTPSPTPVQSFTCLKLTPSQPDKTNKPTTFRFTVESSVKNVTLSGYRFTLTNTESDVAGDVKDTATSVNYTDFILGPGIWKVQAQVKTSAGISGINEACSALVTVSQATPSPTPTKPGQVLGVTLPSTGPESALGGVAGLTAVGYVGRAYWRSRKSVLDALRTIKRP